MCCVGYDVCLMQGIWCVSVADDTVPVFAGDLMYV